MKKKEVDVDIADVGLKSGMYKGFTRDNVRAFEDAVIQYGIEMFVEDMKKAILKEAIRTGDIYTVEDKNGEKHVAIREPTDENDS